VLFGAGSWLLFLVWFGLGCVVLLLYGFCFGVICCVVCCFELFCRAVVPDDLTRSVLMSRVAMRFVLAHLSTAQNKTRQRNTQQLNPNRNRAEESKTTKAIQHKTRANIK